MEGLDGGLFDGPVHPLSLPVGPRVVRLRQLVSDAVFIANLAKDVHSQKSVDRLVSVLGQVGKGHAVVSQYGVDLVGKGFDHAARKVCTVHLAHVIPELDIGELGDPVNGQEHIELALGQAQLGNVDVYVADLSGRKLASPSSFDIARWQPRDAMPLKASVQAGTTELGDAFTQAAHHVV